MIKVGLVGCGKQAEETHLPCYRMIKDVEVTAICDFDQSRVKKLARKFNVKHSYTDFSKLLGEENLDLVDICTPGFTHYELSVQAIEEGVNLLVEKPLALSLRECKFLNQKAKKAGVKVCVMHNYRFNDQIMKAKKLFEDGAIGKISRVVSTLQYGSIFSLPSWLRDENKSGGLLYELAIHMIDLQPWFCGEHEKILGIHKHFDERIAYTTNLQALVKFKNDSVGILDLNLFSSSQFVDFDIYGSACDIQIELTPFSFLRVNSGQANVIADFLTEFKRIYSYLNVFVTKGFDFAGIHSSLLVIKKYVDALRNNSVPPITIDSILSTMKLLEDLKNSG
jgi:predicted dehydrogenase